MLMGGLWNATDLVDGRLVNSIFKAELPEIA